MVYPLKLVFPYLYQYIGIMDVNKQIYFNVILFIQVHLQLVP